MAKNKSKRDPKRAHIRAQLMRNFDFLHTDYKELFKDDLNSKKVFAELFGEDAKFESWKLTAVYEFQK